MGNETEWVFVEEKDEPFKLGLRFYAIAFLVIFYYFFTKPVSRSKAIEIE